MNRTLGILAMVLVLVAPTPAQDREELRGAIEELRERFDYYEELIRLLLNQIRESSEASKAEINALKEQILAIQSGLEVLEDDLPDYLSSEEEEFVERIHDMLDERFREYTRGSKWLKGIPGDPMAKRVAESFGYLSIGGEIVTAAQIFSGLDPFDERPDLQRALNLTRLKLEWNPTENLRGVVEGQFFGNFGTSDTRFEDWFLITPRSGTAFPVPLELVTSDDILGQTGAEFARQNIEINPTELEISNDLFQLYQSYFDLYDMFPEVLNPLGFKVGLRLGRQEMLLGKGSTMGNEFLYGNNDKGDLFFGASMDGVKLMFEDTKEDPEVRIDFYWFKPDELEETAFLEDDSSPDFYGVYGSYTGWRDNAWLKEKLKINIRQLDMGWSLIRNPATTDRQSPSPLPFGLRNTMWGNPLWRNDQAQRFIDRTFADVRYLESEEMMTLNWFLDVDIGERVNIKTNLAYQYGDTAEKIITSALKITSPLDGFPINPGNIILASGDFDAFAGDVYLDVDLSDTLLDAKIMETNLAPRVGVTYAFFRGGNSDDFMDGDVKTFQRLLADRQYGEIMDRAPFGSFLSNVHILGADLSLTLSEKLSFQTSAYFYWADRPSDPNGPFFGANTDPFDMRESLIRDLVAFGDPTIDPFSVITPLQPYQESPSKYLGAELDTLLSYNYNAWMSVFAGYCHFFDGDYFQDSLPDTNLFMHQAFGEDFGRQFDVTGGQGQDYMYIQVKIDF